MGTYFGGAASPTLGPDKLSTPTATAFQPQPPAPWPLGHGSRHHGCVPVLNVCVKVCSGVGSLLVSLVCSGPGDPCPSLGRRHAHLQPPSWVQPPPHRPRSLGQRGASWAPGAGHPQRGRGSRLCKCPKALNENGLPKPAPVRTGPRFNGGTWEKRSPLPRHVRGWRSPEHVGTGPGSGREGPWAASGQQPGHPGGRPPSSSWN